MRILLAGAVLATGAALVVAGVGDGRDASQQPSAARQVAAEPHVVLLVMDEFPGDSLLDRRGRIDPVRYPNFAALAGDSTWFRNAYSIFDSTTKAVPLILDGMWPRPSSSPDRRDHPRSLFDMFARERYRVVASEEATALCPPGICRGARTRRPSIIHYLLNGRPARFNRWVRSIQPGERPGFWMKHLLLPHGPWIHLPSGARTRPKPRDLLPGMSTVPGFADEFVTRHNEQRYLLQLGYTDRLLGRLVRRLKSQGMYDDTLILVTADHGYLWRSGVETRRRALEDTAEELGPVPFIVKRPGQSRGNVNGAYARTLDVPSTIADVLDLRLGYRDDGRSAFSPAARKPSPITFPTRDFTATVRVPAARWQARRRAVVARRLELFGSGDLSSLFSGIGSNRELLGRETAGLARAASGDVRASLAQGRLFDHVRPRSGVMPTQIAGDLSGGSSGRDLALALNGGIEAVGRSFQLTGDPTEHFAFMVPEEALRAGRNRVEVFEVLAGERLRLLGGG